MKKIALSHMAALACAAAYLSPTAAYAETAPANCAVTDQAQDAMLAETDRMTVLVTGKGPDVILIPGLSTPRDVWSEAASKLAGCYRLHLVQVRGFGDAAGANGEGPVLEPLVKDIANYIDTQILKNGGTKPKIIGHSFGGLTAMKLALENPEEVDSIMVVDSLPFYGVLFGPQMTAEQIRPQAEAIRTQMRSATTPGLDDATLALMSKTEGGRAKVGGWAKTSQLSVVGQVFYEVMVTDIRDAMKSNKVPLTMLYPINPQSPFPAEMTDNVYRTSYAPIPHATLQRIDDSAHFIMLDQPEKFLETAAAFLSKETEVK